MVTKQQQTSCNDNIYIFLQFIKKKKQAQMLLCQWGLPRISLLHYPPQSLTAKGQTCHYVKNVNFPSEMANYCMK